LVDGRLDEVTWKTLQANKTPTGLELVRQVVREEIGARDGRPVRTRAVDPHRAFAGAGAGTGTGNVRVRNAGEAYSTVRSVGRHRVTGQPVLTPQGTEAELPSEAETARIGCYLKRSARRAGLNTG